MSKVLVIPGADFSNVAIEQVTFSDKIGIYTNVSPQGSGSVSGGGLYDVGDEVQLLATPTSYYVFKQWSDGVLTNPRTITVGNTSQVYTAEFEEDFSPNTFTWGKGGINTVGKSSGSTNPAMSTIYDGTNQQKALMKAITDVKLKAANGYGIYATIISPTNLRLDAIPGSYYETYEPLLDEITINAGEYFEISMTKKNGSNADITEGAISLLILGTWEWES